MLDTVLGVLVEREDELIGRLVVDGKAVELQILLDGAAPAEVLPAAYELKGRVSAMAEDARDELLRAFLPLVNGEYRESGQGPLAAEEFMARARLAGITLEIDALPIGGALRLDGQGSRVIFHYEDDDMLWGHGMTIELRHGSEWRAEMWG